jgi:hypothetical protein
MDADAGRSPADRLQQGRLVSSLRAQGGVGAVGAACHRDVSDVDGVVLSVVAAHTGRIILSESGANGDQLEDLHATLGEGPCLDAVVTGEPVMVVDLGQPSAHRSWPVFAGRAVTSGIRAIFAFPVLLHRRPVGVLSLYRATAGPLSTANQHLVQGYAHAVTLLLLDDLPQASTGRVSVALPIHTAQVQQAVGVVMEYAGVDAATALHRLRVYSRHSQRPMRDVVAEVRTCRLPFDPTAAT